MVEPSALEGGEATAAGQQQPGPSIAGQEALEAYASLPAAERPPLDGPLRGVLAETALTGLQRYEWRLLAPLLYSLVDAVLADYGRQDAETEGPPRPPPPGFESTDALAARLHQLLDGFDAAPFTLQRLCEVLLEPRKQYQRLEKVGLAIEKLLMVTSTRRLDAQLPPPPPLGSLVGVNDNPKSPYLDGRPPQVLDPQQHQALLQQQAQAMAAAQQQQQQQLRQHQQGQHMAGLPNGLEDEGPPPLEPINGEAEQEQAEMETDPEVVAAAAAHAAAAAEAMQLEAAAFVESALADSSNGPAGSAGGLSGDAGSGAGEGSPVPADAAAAAAAGAAAGGGGGAEEAAAGSVPPTPPEKQPQSAAGEPPAEGSPQVLQAGRGLNGGMHEGAAGASLPSGMDVDAGGQQAAAAGQAQQPGVAAEQAAAEPPAQQEGGGVAAAAEAAAPVPGSAGQGDQEMQQQ